VSGVEFGIFSIRVKDPQSFPGRFWNRAQNVLEMVPLAFVVLKLTGIISWSWWWVLSPVWISGILFFLYLGLWVGLALFVAVRTRM
jgi:hypothetical protein